MHIVEGFAQGGQPGIGQNRGGQPILDFTRAYLVERRANQHAQASLSYAFGAGIDRREMLLGRRTRLRIDPAIFRMYDFEAGGTAACLAETANARAARETHLLLSGEMEKPQSQESGAVADFAQHLPSAAKHDIGQQYF